MADEMTATDDQATDNDVSVDADQGDVDGAEKQPQGFMQFAQKFVDNDPRIQALQGAPEPTAEQQADLRLTAMEIQQNIRYTHRTISNG